MAAQDLKDRTFFFAVAVSNLTSVLPYNIINKEHFRQIIRSSASIGANYRAARRAKSNADFLNKLKIVEEEADETLYFLELLSALNPEHQEIINPLLKEGTEILKIIVASINTVRLKISQTKK
jgi:four helix bundle protein